MTENGPGFELGARLTRTPPPAVIVIFGASGDLTRRKLGPALFNLSHQRLLPPETAIVGIARTEMTDDDFRANIRAGIDAHSRVEVSDESVWEGFASRLRYVSGSFDDAAAYTRLSDLLRELDKTMGTEGNRLYYLATAPEFFPLIATNLGSAGLGEERDGRFARIVVEKPFGSDLASARALNDQLGRTFRERQVYRIDHYLGKETVQNILTFRFGNTIFEPLWNRRYVDHVQLLVAEDLGVEGRGEYYDTAGTMREIGRASCRERV